MSDPHGMSQPPTQPPSGPPAQPPFPPPTGEPGSARPSRLPWVVAGIAVVVAVAAVVALLVGVGRGGGSDRGFDDPEEAVRFMVEHLADGEAAEAAEAFAVDSVVEGYDFVAQGERLRSASFQTWLPPSSDAYDEINESVRRGEVAVELRNLVRSALAPDRDLTQTVQLGDDLSAEDLADELDPEALSDLAVARVDELDRDDEAYLKTLEEQAKIFGADEIRMVGVLYETPDGMAMGGATAVRYGDDWAIQTLSAPLLNIPFSQLEPVSSEQDYLDAVESARGTDE